MPHSLNKLQNVCYKSKKSLLHGIGVLTLFSGIYALFFLPELLSDKFLAPNDGLLQSLPPFFLPRQLWSPWIWGGFPLAADVTPQTWYPVSLLFAAFHSWNGFVISAYVLASSFTYGYLFRLTGSTFAACFAGLVYGMSGFMMAHLGHTSMIHSAAWIPLVIWAMEELRWGIKYRWILAEVIGISCCFLGGHPQIFIYGIGTAILFACFRGIGLGQAKFSYWIRCAIAISIGIFLSGIQFIPTLELASYTPRATLSFQAFLEYSLPLNHLPLLLFPYGFGSYGGGPYGDEYWGQWNLIELTLYVGVLPLLLSGFALIQSLRGVWNEKRLECIFFGSCALISLMLILGEATPLAWLTFHLPGFNKFRVLARHSIIFTFSISVLTGISISNIQNRLSKKTLSKHFLWTLTLLILLLAAFTLGLQRNLYSQNFTESGALKTGLSLTTIGIPLVVFFMSLWGLYHFWSTPKAKTVLIFFLFVLVLDLSSFGWFSHRTQNPAKQAAAPSELLSRYQSIVSVQQKRIVLPQGSEVAPLGDNLEAGLVAPNLSMMWKIPSITGYGPLLFERISQLFSMPAHGTLSPSWYEDLENQSFDIAAVKYAVLPAQQPSMEQAEIRWHQHNLNLSIGQTCTPSNQTSLEFEPESGAGTDISSGITASEIAVVSALACSVEVEQSAPLLEITVVGQGGAITTQQLKAGKDTAEWAYDCDDVKPHMQHQKAKLFSSSWVERQEIGEFCPAHRYLARLKLATPVQNVQSVQLRWIGKSGALTLHKISLVDEFNKTYPLRERMANNPRWNYIESDSHTRVYENQRVLPRVLLVPKVQVLEPEEILTAIQTSVLPDRNRFDPRQVALLEAPLAEEWEVLAAMNSQASPLKPAVEQIENLPLPLLKEISPTHVQIDTNADEASFLVLADPFYPGWQATLDQQPVAILRSNYAFRGVPLPPGRHHIEFKFRPRSFNLGLGMSSAAAALLATVLLRNKAKW